MLCGDWLTEPSGPRANGPPTVGRRFRLIRGASGPGRARGTTARRKARAPPGPIALKRPGVFSFSNKTGNWP